MSHKTHRAAYSDPKRRQKPKIQISSYSSHENKAGINVPHYSIGEVCFFFSLKWLKRAHTKKIKKSMVESNLKFHTTSACQSQC